MFAALILSITLEAPCPAPHHVWRIAKRKFQGNARPKSRPKKGA